MTDTSSTRRALKVVVDDRENRPFEAFKSAEATVRSILSLASVLFAALIGYIAQNDIFSRTHIFFFSGENFELKPSLFASSMIAFIICMAGSIIYLVYAQFLIRRNIASISDVYANAIFNTMIVAFSFGIIFGAISILS